MESKWLRCKVFPGMFSNERLVVIEDPARGEIASILVDRSLVEAEGLLDVNRGVPGRVRVEASRRAERFNVMLPASSSEMGRMVSVPADLLA